ncbi:MAG: hypothetical protein ACI9YM_000094 [Brevundimonas sp.]|uniref:BLUF domain-containing protein n=1 Tax=Brevundimonas sp. TaxID=1871086 RepID=UPI002488790C|nr:BLUF domain-containing protein [Brevundimonas sp.]MDI1280448.1 BLUF domain-containing protein [Brevundimonas sp.]
MLYRLIFVSDAVGPTGTTTLSIAQILGVSERNNRRDDLCSAVLFHGGKILQAVEGARADIDRLMRRLSTDPRHCSLRILSDDPIDSRRIKSPMALCAVPAREVSRRLGQRDLTQLSAEEARTLLGACPQSWRVAA